MLRRFIRNSMGFSQTEANGLLILLPLIFLIVFSPLIYESVFTKSYANFEEDQYLLDSLNQQIQQAFVSPPASRSPENFLFNPNHASKDSLMLLGIPEFLAQRIINYRTKGGKFYEESDLSNIYDFPDSLYQRLAGWIELDVPQKEVGSDDFYAGKKSGSTITKATFVEKQPIAVDVPPPLVVDINKADTIELQKIYGIGPSFARRIVSYRELLGGYVDVDQLHEVYGFTDTLFQKVASFVTVTDTVTLTTIPINIADFKTLVAHPYISYEMTQSIMRSKSQHGKFRKPDDLYRLEDVDSGLVSKLAPYISF